MKEKSDNKTDSITRLKIAKNLRKGIKSKIIILVMFEVPYGDMNVINRFKSPENLKDNKN